MGRSDRKVVKGKHDPADREVRFGGNPDTVYQHKPSWTFTQSDKSGKWAFSQENIGEEFWNLIFPFFQSIGTQTWNEILIGSKKQHHTIDVESLNKCAKDRLAELHIECDEVISLRLGGKTRIYGIWQLSTCSILWYDCDHGDNDTCVCRSKLKHT